MMSRGIGIAENLFTKDEKLAVLAITEMVIKRTIAGYTLTIRDLERTLPAMEALIAELKGEEPL